MKRSKPKTQWLEGDSFGIVPDNALRQLRGAQLHVYLVLARHCNSEGICFPSRQTIAEYTGFDVATVSRAISRLKKDGWLKVLKKGNSRLGVSNLYRVFSRQQHHLMELSGDPEVTNQVTQRSHQENIQENNSLISFENSTVQSSNQDSEIEFCKVCKCSPCDCF